MPVAYCPECREVDARGSHTYWCGREPDRRAVRLPDVLDDIDGDLDEIEAIAAARAAGHGYRPTRILPRGGGDA